MSSSFSDLSEAIRKELRFDRRGRFVMYKKLSNPKSMNNPSNSPVPTDELSSVKEPDNSEVHSSEGMAELLLKYIRHKVEFRIISLPYKKVLSLSIVF